MPEINEEVVERFYRELWNHWDLGVADEILAEGIRFRGSLGSTVEGREAFKGYAGAVRRAFPDCHNRIDEAISCGDRVVTRMTWNCTHRNELMGVEAIGARVEYMGAAIFRLAGGRIEEAWVMGDTQELWKAMGKL